MPSTEDHFMEHDLETLPTSDIDYLVFSAQDHLLALPYFDVIQIIDSPASIVIPDMPRSIRGVFDYMGEAIPLIDTRIRLSLTSRKEEVDNFVKIFMLRKQDHLNWIANLKTAVNRDEEIKVEKDPHKCAFGKWYDTYQAHTLKLASYMKRFDVPHRAIHHLAVQVEELIREGRKEQAKVLIQAAENDELIRLIELFDGFEDQMRQSYREYALIIGNNDRKFALAVDSIKYFEKMDEIVGNVPLFGGINEGVVRGIGRKKVNEGIEDIIILDVASFLDLEK
jgi:chemotaxis signal transduction protein